MLKPNFPKWKMITVVLLIVAVLFSGWYFMSHAKGEDIDCWVLCQPDSWVNARMNPTKKSIKLGYLECGDHLYTDGKIKNGFLHVWGFSFELGEGWVHKGYVVYSQPYIPVFKKTTVKSNGRVAARRTVNGDRRCWLKDGNEITVYMASEEWSVTNKGFVKTKFIDLGL